MTTTSPEPMMVADTDASSPLDASFLTSLEEPLKSAANQALNASIPAASRADSLEIALRSHLLQLTSKQDLQEIAEYWKTCLNLCLCLVNDSSSNMGNAVVRKLPFVLLEDCCETLPLHLVQTLWTSTVEPSIHLLCGPSLWIKTSHLVWIRICNKLLKKLKSSKWAGRILLNLASVFPLSERSAMNVLGTFHTENVVEYESLEEFQSFNVEKEENNEEVEKVEKKKATEKDYAFYQTFWSMQSDFSNPNAINVDDFSKRMQSILAVLESHALEDTTISTSNNLSAGKYLTNSHLLHLQLRDPELRTHFLTQYLIVESFLKQSTKAQQLSQVTKRVKDLLRRTPPHGKAHLETIEWLLTERESMWRQWKRNKCTPDLEKKAVSKNKKELTSSITSKDNDDEDLFHYTIDVKTELPAISSAMKEVVPQLDQHLEEYVEALDPEAGIEAEYHPKNNKLFSWRAMRLLSREHLGQFDMVRRKDGDFERLVRHVYKEGRGVDIPGEAPDTESLGEYDEPPEGQSQESSMDDVSVGSPIETEEGNGDDAANKKAAEFEKAALEEEEEMLQKDEEKEDEKPKVEKKDGDKEKKNETGDVKKIAKTDKEGGKKVEKKDDDKEKKDKVVDVKKITKTDKEGGKKEDPKEIKAEDEKKISKRGESSGSRSRPAAKKEESKETARKDNDGPAGSRSGSRDNRKRGRASPPRRNPPDHRGRRSPDRRDGGRGSDVGRRDDQGRQGGRRDRQDGGGNREDVRRGRSVEDRGGKRRRQGGRRSY